MRYLIEHETVLQYQDAIREHHIEVRLAPRCDSRQTLISCTIEAEPAAEFSRYTDYFGNRVDYFSVIPPHTRLVTRMKAEVETTCANPFEFVPTAPREQDEWLRAAIRQEPRLNDYVLHRSSVTPSAAKLTELFRTPLPQPVKEQTVMDRLMGLMPWVGSVMTYRSGSTGVHADLAAAVSQGEGVCQDFAHLFITIARSWGVPARYVMGYLDPGIRANGEELASHAWAEALVPGGGWIGFDATHNLLANDQYVAVALGRDSYDAAPQRGSFKGDAEAVQPLVSVTVQKQKKRARSAKK